MDYRNGYYFRDFLTQLGRLAGVRIPRTRKGFRSQVLPRYQRRQAAVNQLIREAFLRGISTRQVSDILQPVLGETYSAQTISNITRQLDTARPAVSPRPAARRVSLSFPRRHRAQSARQCA